MVLIITTLISLWVINTVKKSYSEDCSDEPNTFWSDKLQRCIPNKCRGKEDLIVGLSNECIQCDSGYEPNADGDCAPICAPGYSRCGKYNCIKDSSEDECIDGKVCENSEVLRHSYIDPQTNDVACCPQPVFKNPQKEGDYICCLENEKVDSCGNCVQCSKSDCGCCTADETCCKDTCFLTADGYKCDKNGRYCKPDEMLEGYCCPDGKKPAPDGLGGEMCCEKGHIQTLPDGKKTCGIQCGKKFCERTKQFCNNTVNPPKCEIINATCNKMADINIPQYISVRKDLSSTYDGNVILPTWTDASDNLYVCNHNGAAAGVSRHVYTCLYSRPDTSGCGTDTCTKWANELANSTEVIGNYHPGNPKKGDGITCEKFEGVER